MLPTTQEYKISLMIGQDSFRTLEGVEVIPNPNYPDEPWYSTGGLAIVFKLKLNDKLYALKCFYTEANERQERLGLIAAYLKQNPSPYFVDFTYLEDELWVETANDEGQGYPVVLMEWVEGKTLDNYLEQICTQNNTPALKNLYFQFCNLAWWLQQQPIAHGDIKHDNLIVTPDGKLKLIDYDGVFVPALRGRKANEMGSPCYQHPKRDAYFFDKNLDDFSLLVLQITLLALQHQPKLFTEHYNGDGIILKDTDYQNFTQCPIKTVLWQLPEVIIPLLLSQLQGNLNNLNAIDLMPLLQDVAWINWLVDGQKDWKLEFERERLKELTVIDKVWREMFIHQTSKYQLNEDLINRYEDKWNWRLLSKSSNLAWSENLIEKFQDKWNWDELSKNFHLPWSESLIEKYQDKWDWSTLTVRSYIPWTENLIEKYQERLSWNNLSMNLNISLTESFIDKWDDKWYWELLSGNGKLIWTKDLIKKYQDKLSWHSFSWNSNLPFSEKFIEKYQDKLDWEYLHYNANFSWSENWIEKYQDKLNWEELSRNPKLPWSEKFIEKFQDKWHWMDLSCNPNLPWSESLIEKFQVRWVWWKLSKNPNLPWSEKFIEKFQDKWDWDALSEDCCGDEYFEGWLWEKDWTELSRNSKFPWSEKFIEKFKYYLNWKELSKNFNLPWSEKLIEKYAEQWYNELDMETLYSTIPNFSYSEKRWDWEILSSNPSLPWSEKFIEKFQDEWYWKDLSRNSKLPWTESLIEKFQDKWDWEMISGNPNIPWSESFIEKYLDKWYWSELIFYSNLPWTENLVEKYKDKWNWNDDYPIDFNPDVWVDLYKKRGQFNFWSLEMISKNLKLPYTIQFIEKHCDKRDWYIPGENVEAISQKLIEPLLNDEFIDEVMKGLT